MNANTPRRMRGSLIERAAEIYDFGAILRGDAGRPVPPSAPEPMADAFEAELLPAPLPPVSAGGHDFTRRPAQPIDRAALEEAGFVLPDGPSTAIAEEFRLVKRQLLLNALGSEGHPAKDRGNRILVTSANPGDGKTFCAVNLALSLAAEKDAEVLLVDADFAKPSILSTLGLATGPGLMDALADPAIDILDCVIRTDLPRLYVLPAGQQTNSDSENLAAARAGQVLDRLTSGAPNRILLFDSPPVLAASPASELAAHVGQTLMVVRADVTSEAALVEAISMLKRCGHIELLLNAAAYVPAGRKFGSYYGYGG